MIFSYRIPPRYWDIVTTKFKVHQNTLTISNKFERFLAGVFLLGKIIFLCHVFGGRGGGGGGDRFSTKRLQT